MTVDPGMLEAVVRDQLNTTAPRTMVVTEPLKVTVVGDGGSKQEFTVPDFPNEAEKGEHRVVFQSPFFIERDDWRAEAEKGYRRLCPGQSVGLKHAGLVIEWVDSVCEGGKVRNNPSSSVAFIPHLSALPSLMSNLLGRGAESKSFTRGLGGEA